MTQQRIPQETRSGTTFAPADLAAEVAHRQELHEQEAAARATEQETRGLAIAEVEADMDALNARIEALLSANPEEFVIRFLQTEGQ